jgi:hypothetical protein
VSAILIIAHAMIIKRNRLCVLQFLITQIEHATLMVMSFQHWYAEQSDALMSEHPAP